MSYTSLMKRYKDQPNDEIFAHFGYRGDTGETWETPYERLAGLAKTEEWDFHRTEFKRPGQNFPILVGYLNYTFLRVQEQGKLVFSDDGDRACFNTGLQTPNEKDIFATFFKNKNARDRDQPDWNLFGFFDSYSQKLSDFRPLPKIATFIDDASKLVFDTTCNIEVQPFTGRKCFSDKSDLDLNAGFVPQRWHGTGRHGRTDCSSAAGGSGDYSRVDGQNGGDGRGTSGIAGAS